RALVRGERIGSSDEVVGRLAASRTPTERALGVLARVALGDADAESFLEDKDARVRRAAAMGAMARPATSSQPGQNGTRAERAFLARLAKEDDAITRQVLAVGLLG